MPDVPMTDAEIDRLETLLESPPEGTDPLWIDSLQGFLAAVASGPSPVDRSRWMPVAIGAGDEWEPQPAQQELIALVDRLYGDILSELGVGEGLPLLVYPDDEGGEQFDFEPWAAGYLEGVALSEVDWYEAGEEEVVESLLTPMVALSGGLDDDEELDAMLQEEGTTREQFLQRCAEELPLVVQNAFDYWFEKRKPGTVRREGPKVGRNDPCPCGSGRKFKACCGEAG